MSTRISALKAGLIRCAVIAMFVAILGVLSPAAPALADCKPNGIPDHAGSGQPGLIDAAIPEASGGNNYGNYGWSGLRWNNCDIRDMTAVIDDIWAQFDTFVGNAFMGVATLEASIMTSMHKWTADPTATLEPIDNKIADLSRITTEVLFDNWAFPVIVFAAIGIIAGVLTKKVRSAFMTVGATFLALGFIAVVGAFPLTIAQSTDGVASAIISQADKQALEYAGIPGPDEAEGEGYKLTANESEAMGAVLNDSMLAPLWRQGQTGKGEYTKETQDMFIASTASWQEVADGYDPKNKKNDYNKAVDAIKNNDDTAGQYQAIKGQSYNRAGMGFIAMLMTTIVALIRIPAEALMFLGMLVIRFIPILGPIFALMAIPEQTRQGATAALKIVIAAVFNVIVFGLIASVHMAIISILYVDTSNLFVSTIISAVITFLFWKVAKPFSSVTKLATGRAVAQQLADAPSAPGNAAKTALGFLTGTAVPGMMAGAAMSRNGDEGKGRRGENRISETQSGHPGNNRNLGPFSRVSTTVIDPHSSNEQRRNQTNSTGDGNGTGGTTGNGTGNGTGGTTGNGKAGESPAEKRARERSQEAVQQETPNIHAGWTRAPNVNDAWNKKPHTGGARGHDGGSGNGSDDAIFIPEGAPKRVPERTNTSVNVLSEPEFIGGQMVTNIFVPEGAGKHTNVEQGEKERISPEREQQS